MAKHRLGNIFKILRLPELIPCDKRLHTLIGVFLMAIMLIFTTNLYVLVGTLIFVAWGIEFYQKFTHSGTYDNLDAIAVIIGGLIVYLPYIVKGL